MLFPHKVFYFLHYITKNNFFQAFFRRAKKNGDFVFLIL